MGKTIKVSPSILSADLMHLAEEVRKAEDAGGDALHVDIMDGHYCHNFAFGLGLIPMLKKQVRMPVVAHLEIDNPDAFVEDFARAGSDMVVVQEDVCPHLPHTVQRIREAGARAGIGISPDRGLERLLVNPGILREVDLIIVLSVFAGFGGQPFSETALPKIEQVARLREQAGASYDIGVDGCVNTGTVPRIVAAGSNYLIGGSSVFAGDIACNIRRLREAAQAAG
ncbi:MAG: ribulose-phosphate 3-epimerase [Spirochaetota bacterium]